MNKNVKLLSPIVLALASTLSIQSHAAGTFAGTEVINTASLAYDINGQTQDVLEATDKFLVDIKVDFVVNLVNTTPNTTSLASDEVIVAALTVLNEGNAPTSFKFTAQDRTGGSVLLDGTSYEDNIDIQFGADEGYKYYIDTNKDGAIDTNDILLDSTTRTTPSEISVDETFNVLVSVPRTSVKGDDQDVALTDVAVNGVASTIDGTVVNLDKGDNDPANGSSVDDKDTANTANGIEIVYADGVPDGTVALGDNTESTTDVLVLNFPNLNDDNNGDNVNDNFTKTSEVISDPFNGTTNPKAIPGAVVEYTITVTNTGSAAANNVVVEDPIPANTQYIDATVAVTGGTSTDATVSFNKDPQDANDRGTIRAELGNVDPQETNVIVFRVTID